MPTPLSRIVRTAVASLFIAATLPFPGLAQQPAKTSVMKRARQSYYSLKAEGFTKATCTMEPDWNYLLEEQHKADPASIDAAIKKLGGLQFTLVVDADGKASLTHNELPAENEQVAAGLKQIYDGMGQMAEGFFQTWSAYVIVPALPEASSDFRLDTLPAGYRVFAKEPDDEITSTLDQDFVISDQLIKSKDFASTIKPQFKKTPKGLILSAYDATYRAAAPGQDTILSVAIEYQDVNGLQFPLQVKLSGSYANSPFRARFTFTGCQTMRQ